MHILYYDWGSIANTNMLLTLENLKCDVKTVSVKFKDYDFDTDFENVWTSLLQADTYDCIFSFNYFPIIARITNKYNIPYISWVYDCPHTTLYSKTITYKNNYIFLFDYSMYLQAEELGAPNAYHLPLGVYPRTQDMDLMHDLAFYTHDVSFVGSLYTNNPFDQINYLPDYLSGYLNGVINAQQKVWGDNFVANTLSTNIISELCKYVKYDFGPNYTVPDAAFFADIINKKITSIERCSLLSAVANKALLSLYTFPDEKIPAILKPKGYASYDTQMPEIFAHSKINLNITLRSITSGIPLRALDIMNNCGFLLSNYQPELAQYFIPDEDFVYFEDEKDLLNKINYYLTHDKERITIAQNGCKKAQQLFSYSTQVNKILDTLRLY